MAIHSIIVGLNVGILAGEGNVQTLQALMVGTIGAGEARQPTYLTLSLRPLVWHDWHGRWHYVSTNFSKVSGSDAQSRSARLEGTLPPPSMPANLYTTPSPSWASPVGHAV